MKLKDMTAADVIAQFPPIDEVLRRELADKYMPNRLFLFDRNDLACGWCSACEEEVTFPRPIKRDIQHIDSCPRCGEIVRPGRIWAKSGVRDRVLVLRYESIESEECLLGARLFYLERDWRHLELHPWDARIEAAVDSYYLFRYGEGGIEVAPANMHNLDFARQTEPLIYSVRKYVYHVRWGAYVALGGHQTTDNFVDRESQNRAVQGTPFRYLWAAVEGDMKRSFSGIQLFDYAARYPFATECLAKMGAMSRDINWHGRTVQQVFKASLSKADKAYLYKTDKNIDFTYALCEWQHQQKQGIFFPLEDFIELGLYEVRKVGEIMKFVDFRRAARYIKKQAAVYGQHVRIDLGLYRDYIRDCVQLDMDMTKKSVLFPKNLLRQHENLNRQIEHRANELEGKKFAARLPILESKYAYREEKYSIVIPRKPQDLIDEGKAMNHCVGNYIKRVAEGETDILFIRPTRDHDAHLATMEVRNGHIVQARTKNNGKLPEDVAAFVERFREAILEHKGRSKSA